MSSDKPYVWYIMRHNKEELEKMAKWPKPVEITPVDGWNGHCDCFITAPADWEQSEVCILSLIAKLYKGNESEIVYHAEKGSLWVTARIMKLAREDFGNLVDFKITLNPDLGKTVVTQEDFKRTLPHHCDYIPLETARLAAEMQAKRQRFDAVFKKCYDA